MLHVGRNSQKVIRNTLRLPQIYDVVKVILVMVGVCCHPSYFEYISCQENEEIRLFLLRQKLYFSYSVFVKYVD